PGAQRHGGQDPRRDDQIRLPDGQAASIALRTAMDGSLSATGQISSASAPGRADASYGAPDDPVWRWATLSPALLLMLLLSVLPLANLLLTSFYSVSWAGGRAVWVPAGFANYLALARDDLLLAGVVNTLIFAVFAVGGQMLLGFVLAL